MQRSKNYGERRASRQEKRQRRDEKRRGKLTDQILDEQTHQASHFQPAPPLEAKTEGQAHYILAIKSNIITFGMGPAGTGKTYIAAAMAADALLEKQTSKIVITRPAIEAGESLGALPGEKEEKYEPYLQPFRETLNQRLGPGFVKYLLSTGKIEPAPLAYMRGRTFDDCWVILDEAQNTTPAQMKMFLSRIGKNCTVIVNGDMRQTDRNGLSGLEDAAKRLRKVKRIGFVTFEVSDIVRSGIVRDIIAAYES